MKEPIKRGDRALIINSVDGPTGHSVGKEVTVGQWQGEHSVYGNIWRVHGSNLISEYGGTGDSVDCAQSWLQKIDPEDPVNVDEFTKEDVLED